MLELYEKNGILKIPSGQLFLSCIEDAQCGVAVKTVRLREKSKIQAATTIWI